MGVWGLVDPVATCVRPVSSLTRPPSTISRLDFLAFFHSTTRSFSCNFKTAAQAENVENKVYSHAWCDVFLLPLPINPHRLGTRLLLRALPCLPLLSWLVLSVMLAQAMGSLPIPGLSRTWVQRMRFESAC
ncbi:hypothetical protein CALVIDRAFT_594611 [Calocera viscosa TUFC12733]|uniref:Uncharacterized protein n=1 Tax=Calocera viscosa (strain TUFC12733) TaxID=1330018 RepID=A0A167RML0_CALVF|nr:hypothetical protein CALVIDRAFT_594611 [Calocera viscosa TUFC12733]